VSGTPAGLGSAPGAGATGAVAADATAAAGADVPGTGAAGAEAGAPGAGAGPADPTAAAGAGPPGSAASAAADQPQGAHRSPFAGGTAAAKSALREVSDISAWMLASAAILVAFFVAWFAGIVLSFRHAAGLTARDRILQFFEPGTLGWGVAVLVAIALFEVGRRSETMSPAAPGEALSGARLRKKRFVEWLPFGLFVAAVAVTVSAFVGVLVELSNFGNGIDSAFSALINYLALVGVGGAATWLGFKQLGRTHS
jgi:hypothetical protein